jgi:transposase InsO family protein
MNALYRQIGCSKQAIHQQAKREKEKEEVEARVKEKVLAARKIHPRLGSRRLHKTARIEEMGITRFEQMLSCEGLTIGRKRKWMKTTDSQGKKHIYPNLTNGIKILEINELVVGDLTYLINTSGLYYVFLLTDVYSLRIVGWEASQEKSSWHAQVALEKMIQLRGAEKLQNMIHHTDRGSEYRSDEYIGKLQKLGIQISMAKTCLENGYAERTNGLVKGDYLEYMSCTTVKELRGCLKESVHRLNHLEKEVLEDHTPIEYEDWVQTLPLKERPVVEMYNFEKSASKVEAHLITTELASPNQILQCGTESQIITDWPDRSKLGIAKNLHRYRLNSKLF